MTTPRPQSFTAEFVDLKRRLKTLEANRRAAPPVALTYLTDGAGNVIVSADGVRGEGLGKPSLPIPFVPAYQAVDTTGWPVTTSATFADMLISTHVVQNVFFAASITVICGADASAEVQVVDNDTVITDPVITVGVGVAVTVSVIVGFASVYGEVTPLRVQARRTAGTTPVWTQLTGAWGVQTPL